MPIKRVINKEGQRVPVKVWTDDVDEKTVEQLSVTAKLPFIHKWVAAMPDTHLGMGATIGSVIPTDKAIIPSAVGVDIGCGMVAVRLSVTASQLPDNLRKIRDQIERDVPLGAGAGHGDVMIEWVSARRKMAHDLELIMKKHPGIIKNPHEKASSQMGSLGSGNHFIELCIDEVQNVWIMLHSGSRGIGNTIGRYFIEKAKEEMRRWHVNLEDKDLAYLPEGTSLFDDYVEAVNWAQNYAYANRQKMMDIVIAGLKRNPEFPDFVVTKEAINTHHNYVERENHYGRNVFVTRKGAIRARLGELGIIPGSMGDKSYIVRGLGNAESFCSCSHGAGRRMSRTAARNMFTAADLAEQTMGIECPKDDARVDEIPAAYKPIDEVMENQKDLVEVVHTLRQVINVKG